jgi:hypothetical protein
MNCLLSHTRFILVFLFISWSLNAQVALPTFQGVQYAGGPLYSFSSHTFTNCGATGRSGPTLANCKSSYNVSWEDNTNYFNVPNDAGIQYWTVPITGTYTIDAYGATGGCSNAGDGARIKGDFSLTQGDVIRILVGQKGLQSSNSGRYGNGGGGGTFVIKYPYNSNASILVIAGGGAGSGHNCNGGHSNQDATTSTTGVTGGNSNAGNGGSNGNGGSSGSSGSCGGSNNSAGGCGFFTNGGGSGGVDGGKAFVNGGMGGNSTGGFGGGGGGTTENYNCSDDNMGGSGGGGYSGGGGGGGC